MKKTILALLTALACMMNFSACNGGNEETDILQRIAEANTNEALMKNNDTVAFRINYYHADGNIDSIYTYCDADRYVCEDGAGVVIDENGEVYGFNNADNMVYKYLFTGESAYADFNEPPTKCLSWYAYAPEDKVVSTKKKNGKLYINSVVDDLEKHIETILYYGYDFENAVSLYNEYVIDAETYAVLSQKTGINTKSGEKELFFETTMVAEADLEKYQPDERIKKALYEGAQRTVTLIADAGTDKEKSYTMSVGKDCLILPWTSSEFDYNVYLDPECTQIGDERVISELNQVYYLKRVNN